jgi:hypothetical protein
MKMVINESRPKQLIIIHLSNWNNNKKFPLLPYSMKMEDSYSAIGSLTELVQFKLYHISPILIRRSLPKVNAWKPCSSIRPSGHTFHL